MFVSSGFHCLLGIYAAFRTRINQVILFRDNLMHSILKGFLKHAHVLTEALISSDNLAQSLNFRTTSPNSPSKLSESVSRTCERDKKRRENKQRSVAPFALADQFFHFVEKEFRTKEEKKILLEFLREKWKKLEIFPETETETNKQGPNFLYRFVLCKVVLPISNKGLEFMRSKMPEFKIPPSYVVNAVEKHVFGSVEKYLEPKYIKEGDEVRGIRYNCERVLALNFLELYISEDLQKMINLFLKLMADGRNVSGRSEVVQGVQFLGTGSTQSPHQVSPLSLYLGKEKEAAKIMGSIEKEISELKTVTFYGVQTSSTPFVTRNQFNSLSVPFTCGIIHVHSADWCSNKKSFNFEVDAYCCAIKKCKSCQDDCQCHKSIHFVESFEHMVFLKSKITGKLEMDRFRVLVDMLHTKLRTREHLGLAPIFFAIQGGATVREINDWLKNDLFQGRQSLVIEYEEPQSKEDVVRFSQFNISKGSSETRKLLVEHIDKLVNKFKPQIVKSLEEESLDNAQYYFMVAELLTVCAESRVKHRNMDFYFVFLENSSEEFKQSMDKLFEHTYDSFCLNEVSKPDNWINCVKWSAKTLEMILYIASEGVPAQRNDGIYSKDDNNDLFNFLVENQLENIFDDLIDCHIHCLSDLSKGFHRISEENRQKLSTFFPEPARNCIPNQSLSQAEKKKREKQEQKERIPEDIFQKWKAWGAFKLDKEEQLHFFSILVIQYQLVYRFIHASVMRGIYEHKLGHFHPFLKIFGGLKRVDLNGFENMQGTHKSINQKSTNKNSYFDTDKYKDLDSPVATVARKSPEKVLLTDAVIKFLEIIVMELPKTLPNNVEKVTVWVLKHGKYQELEVDQKKLDEINLIQKTARGIIGERPQVIYKSKEGKEYVCETKQTEKDFSKVGISFGKEGANSFSVITEVPPGKETTEKDWVDEEIFQNILDRLLNKQQLLDYCKTVGLEHWRRSETVREQVLENIKLEREKQQCNGITKEGYRCTRIISTKAGQFCTQHLKMELSKQSSQPLPQQVQPPNQASQPSQPLSQPLLLQQGSHSSHPPRKASLPLKSLPEQPAPPRKASQPSQSQPSSEASTSKQRSKKRKEEAPSGSENTRNKKKK